jgi:pimeloyl-ACP methyl ester carboxylesterase
MSALKRIIPAILAILIALAAAACGSGAPAATPTPTNTPLPTATSTPEYTPLPPAPPTLELQQRPSLPAPTLEGYLDVGGHSLSYQCYGEGSPAVIVEAAGGDKPTLSLTWSAVILGVLPTTRICIYDRANHLTSQDVAEELHVLLGKIPVPGPYILVAHSLGGWHARVFAHLYPQEVAGMVLVDTTPTYPDAAVTYATAYPTYSPDETAGIAQNRMSEANVYSGSMLPSYDGLDEQVRQAGSLGDIPLVVIGRTLGQQDLPGLDPATQDTLAKVLLKILADQARLSSKGVLEVATTGNHFISLYQPQIIIDATTQMVQEIR